MLIETKCPLLSKLRFEPITTGAFKGVYAVQARLTDLPGTAEGIVDAVFAIKPVADRLRRRIFRLSTNGPIDTVVAEKAEALCAALFEYGYQIQIVYDGLNWFRALSAASWIIANSSRTEMPHGGNEVWYTPDSEKGPIADPIVATRPETLMYLGIGKRSEEEILDFLSRSRHNWNLF